MCELRFTVRVGQRVETSEPSVKIMCRKKIKGNAYLQEWRKMLQFDGTNEPYIADALDAVAYTKDSNSWVESIVVRKPSFIPFTFIWITHH